MTETAKDWYKATGFVDSDDPMNLTDNLTLSRGTLFQLMEGYAASKPYRSQEARSLLAIKKVADRYGITLAVINNLNTIADIISPNPKLDRWSEMERIAKGE